VLNVVPGVFPFIALKDVAQLDYGVASTAALVTVFYGIMFAFVEVPLVAFLVAPERTTAMTADFNAWLSAHGRRIAIVVLWVVGAYLVVRGSDRASLSRLHAARLCLTHPGRAAGRGRLRGLAGSTAVATSVRPAPCACGSRMNTLDLRRLRGDRVATRRPWLIGGSPSSPAQSPHLGHGVGSPVRRRYGARNGGSNRTQRDDALPSPWASSRLCGSPGSGDGASLGPHRPCPP
jgi:hypothetical protein